ncbi:hypothetical protein GCM10022251_54900 [Phytohabitans flavus]|uniref:Secreted protein n=1 Tax=Phytohabitans flavus TaxID=1076124 RepID=A0A6F8XQ67_9ACTN|nr:hypothetical protein [Phytohabitans flavus]BCB75908.1 hypothetical protein Pflav_023180 [Phytohabitans flavus]
MSYVALPKRALVALIAVAVGVLSSGPAMAADPVWHRARCFSGAIDAVEVSERGQAFLTLRGHLDCSVHNRQARFGYARYDGDSESGQLRAADLRRYRHAAWVPFEEGRYVEDGPVYFAICVVTDYDVAVDCVGVLRESAAAPLEVTPLPRKDVAYSRDIRYGHGGGRPACGGCW